MYVIASSYKPRGCPAGDAQFAIYGYVSSKKEAMPALKVAVEQYLEKYLDEDEEASVEYSEKNISAYCDDLEVYFYAEEISELK